MDTQPNAGAPLTAQDPDIVENKDIAALSYVWILSIFAYFYRRQSPFVRFHAKQGIVLFLLSIGFVFVPIVGRLLEVAVLALAIMGFLSAAQGHKRELPFVYSISTGDFKGLRRSWKALVQSSVNAWHRFRNGKQKPSDQTSPDSSL